MTSLEQLEQLKEQVMYTQDSLVRSRKREEQVAIERDALHFMLGKLLGAISNCEPDLAHYVRQHGPGPDVRLDTLRARLLLVQNLFNACRKGG